MNTTSRTKPQVRALLSALLWGSLMGAGFGCSEDTGAPPLFNAIDPSLQCQSGKVGWDFTTGGNDTDVVPAPVGNEIKVQSVQVMCDDGTTTDLTASYRADCDNKVVCKRPLKQAADTAPTSACKNRTVRLSYSCGNEPTVYSLYRPNFGRPWQYDYTYTAFSNADADQVQLVCADKINIKGYQIQTSGGGWSVLFNDKQACNGLRNCYSNQKSALGYMGTLYPTKFFFTCGTGTFVYESPVAELGKAPIDFSCADAAGQTAVEPNPTLYVKQATFLGQPGGTVTPQTTAYASQVEATIKARCEGQRSCAAPVSAAGFGPDAYGYLKLEYWCGVARNVTEVKYFHTFELAATGKISLQCGGRLKIVSSDQAWVASTCVDGARACSLPPGQPDTGIVFFCEGVTGAAQNSIRLPRADSSTGNVTAPHTLECPLDSKRGGIELVRRLDEADNHYKYPPSLADVGACNGRDFCLVDRLQSYERVNMVYDYTCLDSNTTQRSVNVTIDGKDKSFMSCRPQPKVSGVSGCFTTTQTSATQCQSQVSAGCTLSLTNAASAATIRGCSSNVDVKYTCGSDPTVLTRSFAPGSFAASASPDGGTLGADGGSLFDVTVDCPYDPTPRATPTNKACIPQTCPNNTRRNQQMECEQDSSIVVYPSLTLDAWVWDPANLGSTVLKEGFPIVKQLMVFSSGSPRLTTSQAGTIWAYDVFKKNDNTGPEINGYRCIVSTPTLVQHQSPGIDLLGDLSARDASIIPNSCFNAAYNSANSSWYHGSRVAGINEQQFRNTYHVVKTYVVPSFDTKGRAIEATRSAPNPVGFFYTPSTGYVDTFAYLAQQTDFRLKHEVSMPASTEIDLEATTGKLSQWQLNVGPDSFTSPPTLNVDFNWRMLGDSPYHPGSPNTRLAGTDKTSLRNLNLKASLEISKVDLKPNQWRQDNSASLGSVQLSGGNAQEKVDHLTVTLNRDTVMRLMSVRGTAGRQRPDGWMQNAIEVNSAFLARVCLDFNGVAHVPGDPDLNNKFITATVGGTTYKLGITNRCTAPVPFTVVRDLFPKPVIPVNSLDTGIDKANTLNQGGSKVSSANGQGGQQSCSRLCTVNTDCGGGGMCQKAAGATLGTCAQQGQTLQCSSMFRSGSTSGGSVGFGRSVFNVQSSASGSSAATLSGSQNSKVELMSYDVVEDNEQLAGMTVVGSTKQEVKISLARTWASVAKIGEEIKKLTKAEPDPVKVWYKPELSKPYGTERTLPGVAFGVEVDGVIFAGPVTLFGEFNASVSLGFDIALTMTRDTQTIANKNSMAAYPCLGTSACLALAKNAKTFKDANEDCRVIGGKLAEPRTAEALTALKAAAGSNDVWIGAQAAYAFLDPTCSEFQSADPIPGVTGGNVQALMADCRVNSVGQYQWIDQHTPIADTASTGALFNLRPANYGFSSLTSISNYSAPVLAGVLMKSDGSLQAQPVTDQAAGVSTGASVLSARYVCELQPAAKYVRTELQVTPSIEFSAGVSAALCWPSSVIGACLAAELKFFTVGVRIDMGNYQTQLYAQENDPGQSAIFGGKGAKGTAEIAFLTGNVGVEIRFLIGSENINIVSYSGRGHWEWPLFEDIDRYRKL